MALLDWYFSLWPLCLTAFLDGADASYFRGVFRSLEVDLGFGLSSFATMQMWMSGAALIFNPLWSFMLDSGIMQPKMVLVLTTLGWGITSAAMAFCAHGVTSLICLRFVNTVFLCSALPVGQSIVSSSVASEHRGKAFSIVTVCASVGVIFSTKVSVTISEHDILGMSGWRVGLLAIGLVGVASAAFMMRFVQDADSAQRRTSRQAAGLGSFINILHSLSNVRCFWCIGLFCGFYHMSGVALQYGAMWMQYRGFEDADVGSVLAVQSAGTMMGHLVFGYIGDLAHRWSPLHGRLYAGQLCCGVIIPLAGVLFTATGLGSGALFCALFFAMGFFDGGWGLSTNRPILTVIVPQTQVASVMAWKNVIESAFAIAVWPSLVEWIASTGGYRSSRLAVQDMAADQVERNARALSRTLTWCVVPSHVAMLGIYCVMHWYLKRDLDSLERKRPLVLH